MLTRCTNQKSKNWPGYGGRGVAVCVRWSEGGGEGFAAFLADMGEKPPGLSIERKNNDGNYEPGNCIWATPAQQARNRRSSAVTWDMVNRLRYGDLSSMTARAAAQVAGVSMGHVHAIRQKRVWASP